MSKNPHFINNPFVPFKHVHNELIPKLMGICAMNPFVRYVAGQRNQMYATHLGQTPPVDGATRPFISSGMDRVFGRATFSIKAPEDIIILDTLSLYPEQHTFDGIRYNPERYALYEEVTDIGKPSRVGLMTIPEFSTHHSYFGFRYKPFPAASRLAPGKSIAKDEVIYEVPNRDEDGTLRIGVELPAVFMSDEATAEDGFKMAESCKELFTYRTYERRNFAFGGDCFPVNIYGTDSRYQICPEIGQPIRDDGLVAATRTYDDLLAACEQSVFACQQLDPITDVTTYAEGGGRVIDMRVFRNGNLVGSGVPEGMDAQLTKYHEAKVKFYQELVDKVNAIKAIKGRNFQTTDELHEKLVEAEDVLAPITAEKITALYKQNPLDAWHVFLVIEYIKKPGTGSKFTGHAGDKGVAVKWVPDDHMPIDSAGNRALFMSAGEGTVNRQNPSRFYAHEINAFRDFLRKWVCKELGMEPGSAQTVRTIERRLDGDPALYERVWNKVFRFYQIVAPLLEEALTDRGYERNCKHLAYIVKNNIYLEIHTDDQTEGPDIIEQLEREYERVNGPVTFVNCVGERVTTKGNVCIAHMNILMLEKDGNDWSAVNSAPTQIHGILAQITRGNKYRYPSRYQPPKPLGETEVRSYAVYAGPYAVMEIMDRNNNPIAHKYATDNVISHPTPTNIDILIPRDQVPIEGTRPLRALNHVFSLSGFSIAYKPYVDIHANYTP